MAKNNFNIVISAVDKTTKTIRNIKAQYGQMTRPVTNFQRSVKNLGKEVGFDKMRASIGKATRAVQDFGGRLLSLGAPLMGLIGGGTLAGLSAMVSGFASASVAAKNMADSIGISANQLLTYRGAAGMAGVSSGELDSSLKSLGQTIQDAGAGRNQQAFFFMRRLGVQFYRTKDGAVDVTKTLVKLSEVINNPKIKYNPAVQSRIASTFGMESLLPLLRKGPKAIEEYQKRIDEVSFAPSKQGQENAQRFHESMAVFKAAVEGVKNSISDKLLPVFMPLLERFTKWLSVNRELIATKVEAFFKKIAEFVGQIDFEELIEQCKAMIATVNKVVNALGGWKTIVLAIAGIKLAGFIGGVLSAAGALTNVLAPALRLITGIMIANPILAAAAALLLLAYVIYENWDAVKEFFQETWDEITEAFDGGIEGINALIINWSPVGLFYKVFQKVLDYFGIKLPKKFSDFGKNLIDNIIRGIKGEAPVLMAEVDDIGDRADSRLKRQRDYGNTFYQDWGGAGSGMGFLLAGSMSQGGGMRGGRSLPIGAEENINHVIKVEGGYVANDAGKGETKYGINETANPELRGRIKSLTVQDAQKIYKNKYWDAIGAGRMHPTLASVAFDSAVNQGVGQTRQFLSKSGGDPFRLIQLRREHYGSLVRKNPGKYKQYHSSWMNRLDNLEQMAKGAPVQTGLSRGVSGSWGDRDAKPIEITINAPSKDTKVTAKQGEKVVPVKVNYAMSSDFPV